jgi:mono/diheme cytochrome c family protein
MHVAIDMWRYSFSLLVATSFACHSEPAPAVMPSTPVATAPAPSPEVRQIQLARGEYIAAISGCTTCHGKDLAGGLEVPLGGGIVRMPNVTQDRATGVGAWSDTQIVAAIRQGVRPDRGRLAPLMPYAYYNRMTDADAFALVAYMRSQLPVRKHVARSEHLPMKPLDIAAPVGNVDRVEDPRAHGEYIASLMHCAACHTPQQGPEANQAFAGGTKFPGANGAAVIAPNITPDRDTGIGTFDDADIVRAVRDMKDPTGQDLHNPMAMYKDGYARITNEDAHALVVFLKSVPPVHHDITQENPSTLSQRP